MRASSHGGGPGAPLRGEGDVFISSVVLYDAVTLSDGVFMSTCLAHPSCGESLLPAVLGRWGSGGLSP